MRSCHKARWYFRVNTRRSPVLKFPDNDVERIQIEELRALIVYSALFLMADVEHVAGLDKCLTTTSLRSHAIMHI